MSEKKQNGIYSHKFTKPFEYEGLTFETLDFNFEKLTGRDMISIESEMQALGEYALAPEISKSFQAKMAARAAGISSEALEKMPLKEFNKIANEARSFLADTGL